MRKRLKVITVLLMVLLMIPQFGEAIRIQDIGEIRPMFSYINVFQSTFDISSSGKSSSTVYLNARNVDKIEIEADLQQYKNGRWTTIKSWSSIEDGTSNEFAKDWYVTKGSSYRLVAYGYVYKGNTIVESTSSTSNSIDY